MGVDDEEDHFGEIWIEKVWINQKWDFFLWLKPKRKKFRERIEKWWLDNGMFVRGL